MCDSVADGRPVREEIRQRRKEAGRCALVQKLDTEIRTSEVGGLMLSHGTGGMEPGKADVRTDALGKRGD